MAKSSTRSKPTATKAKPGKPAGAKTIRRSSAEYSRDLG